MNLPLYAADDLPLCEFPNLLSALDYLIADVQGDNDAWRQHRETAAMARLRNRKV